SSDLILPCRSRQSAEKYASVWTDEGSPLQVHTQRQGQQLQEYLSRRGHQVKVVVAMRYGSPSIEAGLSELKQAGCDRILILPLYPQYSGTTTASVYDAVFRHYATVRRSEEHTSELQSRENLVCRLLLEKKKNT